jgi:hypothetical protein
MIRFLLVSMTGWLAVLGVGIEIALPYMLRNKFRSARSQAPRLGSAEAAPGNQPDMLATMWPHYWLGYSLVALVLVHTSFVMGPVMGRTNPSGIWAATLALFLLFLQIGLGLALKVGNGKQTQVRRWHFSIMIAFVTLITIHLVKNG